jgi:DNA topoisomerase-1
VRGFRFRGKSGRLHEVGLRDRRLASVVRRCRDLPGQELFQYEGEDGEPIDVRSDDVNDYLRAIAPDVTAKDFRTWAGTVLAYRALRALDEPETAGEAKRNVVEAINDTADRLGNTAAVCRRSYVHPVVVEAYLDPRLRGALLGAAEVVGTPPAGTSPGEERAVVRLLERRLGRDAARVTSGGGSAATRRSRAGTTRKRASTTRQSATR